MESTMLSLATLPRAPPAALYNPLEHGHSLADNTVSRGHIYYIIIYYYYYYISLYIIEFSFLTTMLCSRKKDNSKIR